MGQRVGRYEIERLIGRGGMAEVYRAKIKDGDDAGRVVALKRMLPELAKDRSMVDLFVAEAQVTRALKHPAIVEVIEVGEDAGLTFIAMEYVDGRDLGLVLRRCVERNISLPVDFAAYVAHVVAQALAHAHTATSPEGTPLGIVHCDVTPSNIFISSLGDIRLGDFGVARTDAAPPQQELVGGKANYLAPEQIRGQQPTPATDIFALGAVLYELLTNRKAFPGDSPEQVWPKIERGEVTPPKHLRSDMSDALEALVLRALLPRRVEDSGTWSRLVAGLRGPAETRWADARSFAEALAPLYDDNIGTPLAIAAVVRGLFPDTAK